MNLSTVNDRYRGGTMIAGYAKPAMALNEKDKSDFFLSQLKEASNTALSKMDLELTYAVRITRHEDITLGTPLAWQGETLIEWKAIGRADEYDRISTLGPDKQVSP